MDTSLIGGSPKTHGFSLTAAHGFKELEQKWNLELESEKEARKCCPLSAAHLPASPVLPAPAWTAPLSPAES